MFLPLTPMMKWSLYLPWKVGKLISFVSCDRNKLVLQRCSGADVNLYCKLAVRIAEWSSALVVLWLWGTSPLCRDISSYEYVSVSLITDLSHLLFPFKICCYTSALEYFSAVVWSVQHLSCSSLIPAQCNVPLLHLVFCLSAYALYLFALRKNNSGYWGNSNIPHYFSSNTSNQPPPKAFCITCLVYVLHQACSS